MLQDDDGYLWFATAGGLSRFDGIEFVNYSQRDGLFRNYVNHLYKDNVGNIWIATVGGVTTYDGRNFKSYAFKSEYEAIQINCIAQDVSGTMWFGTNGAGLVFLRGDSLEYIDEEDGLINNRVRSLYLDNKGQMWCGTRDGINLVRDGRIMDFEFEEMQDVSVSHITGDENGNIWISTYRWGVFHFKNGELINMSTRDGLVSNILWQSYVADDGKVWFSSREGVSEYDYVNNRFVETFTAENGLDFVDIRCILKDAEGNVWLGTNGYGVKKFAGKSFVNYTAEDGLVDPIVLSILEDEYGRMWYGTYDGGVIRYNGKDYENFGIEDGLSGLTIWSAYRDSKNTLWFGTATGLTRYNGNDSFTPFLAVDTTAPEYLSDDKITAICEDKSGYIWLGTRHGLARMDPDTETFLNIGEEAGFNGTNIRSISLDPNGVLWCGAENGVYTYDPSSGVSQNIVLGPDVDEPKVFCIVIKNEDVWVGTDNGLYRGNNTSGFNYLSLGQDSRANFINFLLGDEEAVWAGTNYGLYKITEDMEGKLVIRSFTTHDGIMNPECNMNAVFKDSKEHLWFGTASSLVRYDWTKFENKDFSASLVSLRGMRLFLEKTDWKRYGEVSNETRLPRNLELPHNKNHLTFDFILFNYSNPKGVTYQYKMAGFDEDWSPPTHSPLATYSNLPPGSYTFMVRAKASSGTWTAPTTFDFTIRSPFWNTWWFYVICSLLAVCIGLGIWVWRQAVSKRKRETEQLVYKNKLLALEHQSLNASMNRHFIFNALNSIQYYINRQDRISANKYLSSFAKLIRKNLDSSSSGNNYVTLAEEIERIELYLSLEHMRFRNKFDYEIKYVNPIDTESVLVPAMLLQPFIENSIWHGVLPMESPGKIVLSLDTNNHGDIRFEITDNGIGIDVSIENKQKNAVGHDSKGMKITSGRINLLKTITRKNISLEGPFQVLDDSGKSMGTKVVITIPTNTMETFF